MRRDLHRTFSLGAFIALPIALCCFPAHSAVISTDVVDELDAMSFPRRGMHSPGQPLFFSVDRIAVGLASTAVHSSAAPGREEAHGDLYRIAPGGGQALVIDEESLGLTPGFTGEDLDGFDFDPHGTARLYFSIELLSPSNGFGTLAFANDIFQDSFGNLFASGELHIGLLAADDLDALLLFDNGTIGQLDPGMDHALFSLSSFSPSTFTGGAGLFSPGDILITDFTGSFRVFLTAEDLGLRRDDELNALAPEPSALALVCLGLGVAAFRRLRPRGTSSRRVS